MADKSIYAEELRREYLKQNKPGAKVKNICRGVQNWNGCAYCDIYAGNGLPCWEQTKAHNCVHCEHIGG